MPPAWDGWRGRVLLAMLNELVARIDLSDDYGCQKSQMLTLARDMSHICDCFVQVSALWGEKMRCPFIQMPEFMDTIPDICCDVTHVLETVLGRLRSGTRPMCGVMLYVVQECGDQAAFLGTDWKWAWLNVGHPQPQELDEPGSWILPFLEKSSNDVFMLGRMHQALRSAQLVYTSYLIRLSVDSLLGHVKGSVCFFLCNPSTVVATYPLLTCLFVC